MVKEVTFDNFKEDVLNANKLVLIDFFATWCGPCKMLSPTIDEIATEFNEEIIVGKIDIDDNMDIATDYKIKSVPTLLFFKNGEVVESLIGVHKKDVIKGIIDRLK